MQSVIVEQRGVCMHLALPWLFCNEPKPSDQKKGGCASLDVLKSSFLCLLGSSVAFTPVASQLLTLY